jgi:hypothetical protein
MVKIGDKVNIKITDKFAHFRVTESLTILFDDLSKYIATDLTKPYIVARILKYNDYTDDYTNDYYDDDDSSGLLVMREEHRKKSSWCCWRKKINVITLHLIEVKYQKCIRKMFIIPYSKDMFEKWCEASQYICTAIAMDDYFEQVKSNCKQNSLEMHKRFDKDHFVVVSDCFVEVNSKKYVLLRHSNPVFSGTYYEIMDKLNSKE